MSMPPLTRGAGSVTALSERRTHERRSVIDRRLVTVSLDKKDAGLLVDVGEGGICVQVLGRVKAGASSSLHFELPGTGNRVEATGNVAWVDEAGRAGIRFLALSDVYQQRLKEWVALQQESRAAEEPRVSPVVPAALGSGTIVTEIATLQREIAAQKLDEAAALSLILERARARTRADGAAIALGNAGALVCRASSGMAPPLGAPVRSDSGISSECVRTGLTIRCDDTELDPRVDVEACRALGLRSVIIVPLFSRGEVTGLLEVFYTRPHGFDGRDVLALRRVADFIAATIARDTVPEPRLSAPVPAAVVPPPPRAPATPPPRAAATTPAPPTERPVAKPGYVVCDACGHVNPEYLRDCEECDIPLRIPPEEQLRPVSRAAAPAEMRIEPPFASFTRAARDAEARPGIILRLTTRPAVLVLLLVVLAAAGYMGWRQWQARGPVSSTPRVSQPAQSSGSLLPTPAQAAPAPSVAIPPTSALPQPSLPSPRTSKAPEPAQPPVAEPRERGSAPKNSFTPPSRRHSVLVPASPQRAVLSQPPAPVAQPPTPPRPSGVIPARLIARVEPTYPEDARRRNIEGTVMLRITVSRSGEVTDIQKLEGDDSLAVAAIDAVRKWRYTPQVVDGKPTDSDTIVTLQFSLSDQ